MPFLIDESVLGVSAIVHVYIPVICAVKKASNSRSKSSKGRLVRKQMIAFIEIIVELVMNKFSDDPS